MQGVPTIRQGRASLHCLRVTASNWSSALPHLKGILRRSFHDLVVGEVRLDTQIYYGFWDVLVPREFGQVSGPCRSSSIEIEALTCQQASAPSAPNPWHVRSLGQDVVPVHATSAHFMALFYQVRPIALLRTDCRIQKTKTSKRRKSSLLEPVFMFQARCAIQGLYLLTYAVALL